MPDDALPGSGSPPGGRAGFVLEHLPAGIGTPVFSVAEARALGLPPSRLRRKEFDSAGHGLRVVRGSEPTLLDRVRPLAPASGFTVASHTTAAALWGMWLPRHLEAGPLHLTRPLRFSQPRRSGVTGHNAGLQQQDVFRWDGLLVTSPAFTWTDLAACFHSLTWSPREIPSFAAKMPRPVPVTFLGGIHCAARRSCGRCSTAGRESADGPSRPPPWNC